MKDLPKKENGPHFILSFVFLLEDVARNSKAEGACDDLPDHYQLSFKVPISIMKVNGKAKIKLPL